MSRTARACLALLLLLTSSSHAVVARGGGVQPRPTQPAAPIGSDTIRIGVLKNRTYEVVTLPMEVYVGRVLAGEAAPGSLPASLESLAVAIRTYTTTNRGRHGADGFDLCDQTHCQVMRTANAAAERAAVATAAQLLLYKGAPATVFYSASCGGRSEKPSNVWPGADDPPYLSVHDDDGCGGFPMWSAELADADLQRAFTAGGFTGTLRDLRVLARNDSGRVARLALDGLTPREISGQDLRMVVGRALGFQHIQSASFDLRRSGRAFRFSGHGAGHGVGLCVIGSMKLAAQGESAAQILARYFPGTTIGSLGPRLSAAPPRETRVVPPAPASPGAAPRVGAAAAAAPLAGATSGAATVSDIDAIRAAEVQLTLPEGSVEERGVLSQLVVRERQALAQALGVPAPPVRLRVHDSTEAYERAAGRRWFTLGAVVDNEVQLAPLWLLRDRGMLERTLRRQLVHLMVDGELPAKPAWVREGASIYFADSALSGAPRVVCPQDRELQSPVSLGALGDAFARARGCFERQVTGSRDWRKVR